MDASELELERDSPITTLLAELIAARTADMSLVEAMKMTPVRRATDLIVSTGGQFRAVAFATEDDASADKPTPTPNQPMAARRPDPNMSRRRFVWAALASLLFDGELILERIGPGARILPADEVEITWDNRRLFRRYSWRGRDLDATALIHTMIGDARVGQLRGSSPLRECLPALAPLQAAEDYALAFFAAGGVPEVVLKVAAALDEAEADALKTRWINSRTGPDPAVLSGGVDADFPAINPNDAQMLETRAQAATTVARMLGIPGALLHVETSGSTITYTNADGAILALVKATVYPMYLAAIEDALEQLAGLPVRFVTNAGRPLATLLEPVDIAGRPVEIPEPGPGRPRKEDVESE